MPGKYFAHMVFFQLLDFSDPAVDAFLDYCVKYLSNHDGQVHFSLGLRAVDIHRDVSDSSFDVAMHIIFENRGKYDDYAASQPHQDFITETAGMSTGRRVLDSYIERRITGLP
ncbi:Dabb family protein [Mesorhizobium sp. M4B.F.Ca.ET.017.02.2.1]|uniref:Dabb family protein n=1 Tax=Mesorhizobium sp. M4B.F.Ca.ET.017.02.2.1 TaxID=2496649 RepID=UPI000FCB8BCE|nr:Dabb family protein [Mesorhizobium sp. M4B.F.Ca.ET.017.02.2.1]RVD31779.1 Dabb family protein [Mesorhizobium sp. M4B.F.Ca.ET.017.02.2.1]